MDKKPIRVLPVEVVQTLDSLKTAIDYISKMFNVPPEYFTSEEQKQCDKDYAESLKDCEK